MNKKNITINTDFFNEGNDAKLIEYSEQNLTNIQGKQVSSRVDQYPKDSIQNSVNIYRYEVVPDNQYTHEQYHGYENSSRLSRKLQAANEIENILSRSVARLFIGWWQELIAKLRQQYYLSQQYKSSQQTQKEEIMQDYNNVFNNHVQQQLVNPSEEELRQNVFSSHKNRIQSVEDRKRQVMERQNRGVTLDSLEKLKVNRSKSGTRFQAQKDGSSSLKPNLQSKQTFVNEQAEEKSVSGVSRKSYRDKFIEYKHRSISKEPGMPKSQTYTKFVSYLPHHTQAQQTTSLNRTYTTNKIRNVQSATNIQQSKNDILRNINHLLMDREDIYQGEDIRYYVNHRDSSKNIYSFDALSYQNYPGSSYSRPAKMVQNQQLSTEIQSAENQDDEMARARLIDEIVQKLKYSKLRLEEVQKKQQKNDELQMMRKLTRLQKVIMELKTQNQAKSNVREPQIKTYQKSSEEQLYKKFIQEMASIKAQINVIKSIRQSTPPPPPQLQRIIVDNSSSHIISQQQKLLSSYQREYKRLLHEREIQKVVVVPKQPETLSVLKEANSVQQSLFGQLIENGRNQTKKVGWNDGWEKKQEIKEVHSSTNINHISNQTIQSRSQLKNQHVNREGFENYRYTRRQVLEDIGMRAQVEQEQRIWRENQSRQQLNWEIREIEGRQMTEKVNTAKKLQINSDGCEQGKSIRQKHEQNLEKYQKQRIDIDEDINKNFFCQLFPCK